MYKGSFLQSPRGKYAFCSPNPSYAMQTGQECELLPRDASLLIHVCAMDHAPCTARPEMQPVPEKPPQTRMVSMGAKRVLDGAEMSDDEDSTQESKSVDIFDVPVMIAEYLSTMQSAASLPYREEVIVRPKPTTWASQSCATKRNGEDISPTTSSHSNCDYSPLSCTVSFAVLIHPSRDGINMSAIPAINRTDHLLAGFCTARI